MATNLEPGTDGTLNLTVRTAGGNPVTDATVTARVVNPLRTTLGEDLSCPHVGDGVYALDIPHTWSYSDAGAEIRGLYTVYVTVVRGDDQRAFRTHFHVRWNS